MSRNQPTRTRWRGEPLKRGRHGMSADDVRSSQRERLIEAMLRLSTERGYAATSVPDVVSAARVSRSAFYEQFTDKIDCYLALTDQLAEQLTTDLVRIANDVARDAADTSWAEGLRVGVRAYLRFWQTHREHAVAYLVELPSAGTRAIEHRESSYAPFEEIFIGLAAWARDQQPELPPLPSWVPRLLVISITELVASEVRHGRLDQLHDREDQIVYLISRLIADTATVDVAG